MYRSQVSNLRLVATNDFGVDWAFSYSDDRLLPDGANVVAFRSDLRTDTFVATATPGVFLAPMEFYERLTVNASGEFELRDEAGMVKTFKGFGDPDIPGRLVRMEDREGNFMTFHYEGIDPDDTVTGDEKHVLAFVIDTLGREVRYQYYARTSQAAGSRVLTIPHPDGNPTAWGRLARVIDFKDDAGFDGTARSADFPEQASNRTLAFDYDQEGNLIAVTSPLVLGTPTGNDFPLGKTFRYDYLREADIPAEVTGTDRQRLLHNLFAIQAPNETALDQGNADLIYAREVLLYATDPDDSADFSFDRVLTYMIGGMNASGVPAGGAIQYAYDFVSEPPIAPGITNYPFMQTTVTDRRGNVTEYVFSIFDTLLERREFTRGFHGGEPTAYVARYQHNVDKRVVREDLPEGNTIFHFYSDASADRFRHGNEVSTVRIPDLARWGDQTTIRNDTTYEPIYQQPAAVTDPRGLDPTFVPPIPDPSKRSQRERYTTRYFFDYQESTERAADAPDTRLDQDGSGGRVNESPLIGVDADVRTTEVWLVQELGLPENTDPELALTTLRNRLTAAGVVLGLGDLNADGKVSPQVHGDIVRMVQPSVVLLPDSNQAGIEKDEIQDIVTLFRFNQFSQMTSMVDPEGNIHEFTFFPETDPDGDGVPTPTPAGRNLDPKTGGYLSEELRDTTGNPIRNNRTNPIPVVIRTAFAYDDVGNVIRVTDGRGIRTDFFVNELNQVVQTVRAAGVPKAGTGDPSEPLELTAFAYLSNSFYDFNNNAVLMQVEDRGNTSSVDGNPPAADLPAVVPGAANPDPFGGPALVDTVYKFDILDNQVEMVQEVFNFEVGIPELSREFLRTRFRFDANENLVLTILPEGNATSAIFDERDLTFQTTRGALVPPAEALLADDDPRDYNVRGGILCQCTTFHYDGNQNVTETVDAADTDLSPDNNSDRGGPGDRTRFVFDGFDRRTSMIDSVGNQTVYQYDPASNMVRMTRFGPVGGLSPTSDGRDVLEGPVSFFDPKLAQQTGRYLDGLMINATNLVNANLLEATESVHDELNRVFQTDRVLFVNTIATDPDRPPDVADGAIGLGVGKINLTPGDNQPIPGITNVTILGRVTTRTEYDRSSRRTFTVEDDGDTSRTDYDGADRVIKTEDPEGNTVETAYDDNSNVIETRETDRSLDDKRMDRVEPEIFLTTNFYDSLDRLQRSVDNLGQTMDYRYDSRDNLVAMADAQGPLTGQSITRRAYPDGPRTVNDINDFGNVTRYFYDGINRRTQQDVILTDLLLSTGTTHSGDGEHIGASIFGVKNDLTAPESLTPPPDTDQGGDDGIIRTGYNYDQNSLLSSLIDDQGNVTLYLYDNLNRRVSETKGLVVGSAYRYGNLFGDRQIVTPTAETINDPDFIPAFQVQLQLLAARARIAAVAHLFPSLADRIDDRPPTTIIWGHDEDDNILILEDENDSEVFTKYDAINRRTIERVFRAGQADIHSEFNPARDPSNPTDPLNPPVVVGTNMHDYEYDGLSRLVEATDNNDPGTAADDSTITYAHDSLNRVIEEMQLIGTDLDRVKVISSGWRAENLRSKLVYPNDRVLIYRYDRLDRLDKIGDEGVLPFIVDYDYIGVGRMLVRSYPINGTRMTYLNDAGTADAGYDGLRRPIRLRHLRADNSLIVGFTHTYDRMNNKLTEGKLHDPGNREVYTYDSDYRLIDFDRPNAGAIAPLHSDWKLDGAGNWQQVVTTEFGAPVTENREYSSFNELTHREDGPPIDLDYDDNGNQTDDGNFIFQWDFQNRLRTVTRKSDGALIVVYSYDAANRRIRKVVTNSEALNGTTDFYYDGWRVLEERSGATALVQQYVYGVYIDEPLVLDRNLDGDGSATGLDDQRLFYHQNTLYHVFALTNAASALTEAYQYDVYGRALIFADPGSDGIWFTHDEPVGIFSNINSPYAYTGQRLDIESRLMYFKNRYYATTHGRFLSRDPAGYEGSPNLYEYVDGRVTQASDPLGLQPVKEPKKKYGRPWYFRPIGRFPKPDGDRMLTTYGFLASNTGIVAWNVTKGWNTGFLGLSFLFGYYETASALITVIFKCTCVEIEGKPVWRIDSFKRGTDEQTAAPVAAVIGVMTVREPEDTMKVTLNWASTYEDEGGQLGLSVPIVSPPLGTITTTITWPPKLKYKDTYVEEWQYKCE